MTKEEAIHSDAGIDTQGANPGPHGAPSAAEASKSKPMTPPSEVRDQSMLNAKAKSSRFLLWVLGFCGLIAIVLALLLWDKLSHVQELLARQSADTSQVSLEAKTLAKESMELSRDTAAKLALAQNKLNEVIMQRAQMDALMQNLTRSRDETLVEDIEASLRLAQQQAVLSGSLQPLLAALKTCEERLSKVSQPRLSVLQRAIAKDTDRVKSFSLADTPHLLIQFDEMMRLLDELPLVNDVIKSKNKTSSSALQSAPLGNGSVALSDTPLGVKDLSGGATASTPKTDPLPWAQGLTQAWWQKAFNLIWQEFKGLVRVSQIDQPQSILLSPEQAYFVRENLKLRLLNARMALLARQTDTAKADASFVQNEIQLYFDLHQKSTSVALGLLQNIQLNLKQLQLPPLSESFSAIAQIKAQSGH